MGFAAGHAEDVAATHDADEHRQALELGKTLASERIRRRLSQQELAAAAGVAQATVSRIERGERLPSLRTLRQLAAAMDLAPFVSLRPLWEDVDTGLDRHAAVPLEDRCEPWRPWLASAVDGHDACGLAITGELGALVQGLPIQARFVDLVAGGTLASAEAVTAWLRSQFLQYVDPSSWLRYPDRLWPYQMIEATHLFDGGHKYYRVRCTRQFASADVIRVDTCGLSVPVVALHRIAAQDAWVATVWRRWRERLAG